MEGLLVIVGIGAILATLDLIAYRWGADSRDQRADLRRPSRTAFLTLR